MASFSILATEIIVDILCRLPYRDVVRCEAVSKRLCDIIRLTPALQYLVELAVAGMVDSAALPSMGITQRLSNLSDYQRAWTVPRPTCVENVNLAWEHCSSWSHFGNIFARSFYEYASGRVRTYGSFNRLDLVHLAQDGNAASKWTLETPQPFQRYSISPAQDLVVLWSHDFSDTRVLNLFTRSLTDGTAIHPELISIDLKLQSHYMGPFVNTSIQIVDDLILFRISAVQGVAAEVFILHWPTGTIRSHLLREAQLRETLHASPCLLSDHLFALPVVSSSLGFSIAIEVYRFGAISHATNDEPSHEAVLVAIFGFPPIQAGMRPAGASMSSTAPPGLYRAEAHCRPFKCSPCSALLVMECVFGATQFTIRQHHLVVTPISTLLDMIGDVDGGIEPVVLPWDKWGPSCARWFPLSPRDNTLVSAKYAYRIHLHSGVLLDFNPVSLARDICRGTVSPPGSTIVTEETVIPAGGIFPAEIVSKLPYRRTACAIPDDNGHLCGGEDWVLLQFASPQLLRIDHLQVLSF